MKQKKSPIELFNIHFTDYTWEHLSDPSFKPEDRYFDLRHDFLIDKNFAGIAAELNFYNIRRQDNGFRGIRRPVTLLLFDATDRVLISTRQLTLRIPKTKDHTRMAVAFPFEETDFRSGHAYRLQVRDDNTGLLLGEGCFRTYSDSRYGDPSTWYEPLVGGLVPDGESRFLRSCDRDSRENRECHIRFEIWDALKGDRPDVMPELEVRLYSPEKLIDDPYADNVTVNFIEPRYAYRGDFTYIVDLPIGLGTCDGVYYAELLCMDAPIAGFVFTTDRDIEGHWTGDDLLPLEEYDRAAANRRYNESIHTEENDETAVDFDQLLEDFISSQIHESPDSPDNKEEDDNAENADDDENNENAENEDNDENLLAELDNLTGLDMVKEKVRSYDSLMRFCLLRARNGLEMIHAPLHAMFLGSPGTGKTTVARLMGKMLRKAGVLSNGHVVVRERSTLIGKYYNSEAENTLAAIEEAQGGILFIDEAHSLFQPQDPKDPGKFVVEALLTALADPAKDDWMLILAGYPEEMKRLFQLNPGFKSRIPDSNIYTFEDFSEEQLMEIAERRLESLDFTLSSDAREALRRRLASDYADRDRNFGNARHVMNLVETEILPAMAARVMEEGATDRRSLQEIQASDIPMAKPRTTSLRRPLGFGFLQCS